MIQLGDQLPDVTLFEYHDTEEGGCSLGPNRVKVREAAAGRTLAIFALPGAFTPTCSAKHVPGYLEQLEELRAAGVDEVWCISVNDAHVMGAWARDQGTVGKLRMLGDGEAEFTKAVDLGFCVPGGGMGLRSQRYSMLVQDGVVRTLNIEAPRKFEVSDAQTMLAQAREILSNAAA